MEYYKLIRMICTIINKQALDYLVRIQVFLFFSKNLTGYLGNPFLFRNDDFFDNLCEYKKNIFFCVGSEIIQNIAFYLKERVVYMTQQEAKEIIKKEELRRYNWFDEHPLKENEVGIKVDDNKWIIYVTDERASIVSGSVTQFHNESDALDNFIKRLRTDKILFNN